MKPLKLLLLAILAILLNNCSEEPQIQKEKVQFSLDLNSLFAEESGRGKSAAEIPLGATLRVSVKTGAGADVLLLEEIELLHAGGSVITAPIELSPGAYKLTDFMIVSKDDEILFAAPRRGSALEKYVINPLDVNFSISSGTAKNVSMEVLDVSQHAPETFGYASFNINVVHPLDVVIFIPTTSGMQMTSAKLVIEKGKQVMQTINLANRLNKVSLKQEVDETYTLRITKPGYLGYQRDFIYNDLINELNGSPLQLTLQPGMTVVTEFIDHSDWPFTFNLQAYSSANLVINWGDGTVEHGTGGQHIYLPGKRYMIHITGDLNKVYELRGHYGNASLVYWDTSLLVGLQSLIYGFTNVPEVVDLRSNINLHTVSLPYTNVSTLLLPSSELMLVEVSSTKLTSSALNAIIDKVYSNTVASAQYGGTFIANQEAYSEKFIATPSTASMAKLRTLRDRYHWTIVPELE